MDTPLLEAIVKDVNPNIAVLDFERLQGYIEVLSEEPQYIQKIVKAYLENTEQNYEQKHYRRATRADS